MKILRIVVSSLIFSGLALYSFFLIPSANADYYGYGNARDYYEYDTDGYANYYQNANYTDPYYSNNYYDDSYYNNWPAEANWFNDSDWFNRNNWQYQNNWFNAQYSTLNSSRCANNYYRPNNYSSIWKSRYYDGNRRLIWNNYNQPMFNLRNYNSRNWVYSNQYGNNFVPSYARAISIVDASNSNNAILIVNGANYDNYGYSGLNRASVEVNSAMFNELMRILDNIGSNCNMNLDCQNNYMTYGNGSFNNCGYVNDCRGI